MIGVTMIGLGTRIGDATQVAIFRALPAYNQLSAKEQAALTALAAAMPAGVDPDKVKALQGLDGPTQLAALKQLAAVPPELTAALATSGGAKPKPTVPDLWADVPREVEIAGPIGVVVGTALGALLWRSNRIAGALLGGMLVGPACGAAVGYGIASSKEKSK